MSTESKESSTPLAEISHGPSASEEFFEKNQRLLIIIAIVIALGTAGYVVYDGVEEGRQESAATALVQYEDKDDLESIIKNHAGTQAAKSAEILLADQQWLEGYKDDAIATLESFLATNPDHPAAPTATASLASKLVATGKTDEGKALFQDILDNPQARYIAPFAMISLGDIANANGDKESAKSNYERVEAEFPESFFVNQSKQRLIDLNAVAPEIVKPAPAPEPEESPKEDAAPETSNPDATLPSNGTPDAEEEKPEN